MADRGQIEATYDYLDELWRLSLGECADITCAMFDGDFSKPLEAAQADKHEYILSGIGFTQGMRVLDVGCGWGGFLNTIRGRGGTGVGLTLSTRQYESCRRHGLDVRLLDWKRAGGAALGEFGGVVSVGAFEHFCSQEEWRGGKQEEIYRAFFAMCGSSMPAGGRLYLQTMTWGQDVPSAERMTTRAPRGSDAYILGCILEFFPGSWLPYGVEQIRRAAEREGFSLLSEKNGRRDYIRTMREWGRRVKGLSARKVLALARMGRHLLSDRSFLRKLETIYFEYNPEVFERGLFDHQRMVFARVRG